LFKPINPAGLFTKTKVCNLTRAQSFLPGILAHAECNSDKFFSLLFFPTIREVDCQVIILPVF